MGVKYETGYDQLLVAAGFTSGMKKKCLKIPYGNQNP